MEKITSEHIKKSKANTLRLAKINYNEDSCIDIILKYINEKVKPDIKDKILSAIANNDIKVTVGFDSIYFVRRKITNYYKTLAPNGRIDVYEEGVFKDHRVESIITQEEVTEKETHLSTGLITPRFFYYDDIGHYGSLKSPIKFYEEDTIPITLDEIKGIGSFVVDPQTNYLDYEQILKSASYDYQFGESPRFRDGNRKYKYEVQAMILVPVYSAEISDYVFLVNKYTGSLIVTTKRKRYLPCFDSIEKPSEKPKKEKRKKKERSGNFSFKEHILKKLYNSAIDVYSTFAYIGLPILSCILLIIFNDKFDTNTIPASQVIFAVLSWITLIISKIISKINEKKNNDYYLVHYYIKIFVLLVDIALLVIALVAIIKA